jgi:hypothetical protein
MDAVIAVYPDHSTSVANAHLFKGVNFHYSGRLEQGIEHYRAALMVPLEQANIYHYRGKIDTAQHRAVRWMGYALGTDVTSDPQIAEALRTMEIEIQAAAEAINSNSTETESK